MASIQDKASEALKHFGTQDRGDEKIIVIRDGAPQWVTDLAHHAHGDMFPDDLRYEYIQDALQIIADEEDEDFWSERVDSDVDVYTSDLTGWLASRGDRYSYVDDAVEEHGYPKGGLVHALQMGQYKEREEVLYLVRDYLTEQAEDDDCDDDTRSYGSKR